jgi:4-hydroxybenzoate polyprenyltransferase
MTLALSRREKLLYHQIHPLKLGADISSSVASTWLLWRHELLLGMLVGWVPAIVVTALMVSRMELTRQRDSRLGRYVAHHMTRVAEGVRFGGQFAMWFGAWWHAPWLIAAGVGVIIVGWTYSLPFGRRESAQLPER